LKGVIILIAFSILLLVPVATQNVFAVPMVTVSVDQASYEDGDLMVLSGSVSEILTGESVTLRIISSDAHLITLAQLEVNPDMTFGVDVAVGGPLWRVEGTYIVKVTYSSEASTAVTTFEYICPECPGSNDRPENPTITVMTDKNCYNVGDVISITGEALPFSDFFPASVQLFFNDNLEDVVVVTPAQDGKYDSVFPTENPLLGRIGVHDVMVFYDTATSETSIEVSNDCTGIPVGGTIIPIETSSLLLANAQSFSWMIPVVLSGIGIGLFVVSRKSKNSHF